MQNHIIPATAEKKKKFKISIRSKIIISYISIVLVMAFFSILFVSMFYETYMLSDANEKLEREAKEFAAILETSYRLEGSIVNNYSEILLNQRLNDFNYSLMIVATDGTPIYGYNTSFEKAQAQEFAKKILDEGVFGQGTYRIEYNEQSYAIYLQPVGGVKTGERICYVVPFYSAKAFSLSRPFFTFYLLTIIISANFAIIIGGFLSGTITRNLKKLKIRANLLANRKFDASLPISSHDEIEELSNSFDVMAQSIKEYDVQQKTFLQNSSHEFRTPLTSIRGFVEGIRDGIFDVPTATDMILDQVGRLEGLVDDVMFLSKIETTEGMYTPSTMTAEELISEVNSRVSGMILHNDLKIYIQTPPDVTFIGDCDKLATVVTNLISNCVRFAKTTVSINTKTETGKLILTVSDDGPGIADKDMDNLFVRFYKGKKGNHGLGLSIAKAITTAHNGTIKAYNLYGQTAEASNVIIGAAFEVAIPLNNTEDSIK